MNTYKKLLQINKKKPKRSQKKKIRKYTNTDHNLQKRKSKWPINILEDANLIYIQEMQIKTKIPFHNYQTLVDQLKRSSVFDNCTY